MREDQRALEKARLRALLKRARKGQSHEDRMRSDALIRRSLRSVPEFAAAQLVLSYLSFGEEVDTVRIIEEAMVQGKRIALPRVTGPGQMSWHEIFGLEGLRKSSMGILEPPADAKALCAPDLRAVDALAAIVPGLGFDARGYRVGYGGGFYDRFLPSFHEMGGCAIGLCRENAFILAGIPYDRCDHPVDIVVTEAGERVRRG